MKDDWINKAFDNAEAQFEHAKKINERVDSWMETETEGILSQCEAMFDARLNKKLATIMMDEEVSQGVYAMCRFFAVAGYYWCLIDNKTERGI